MKSYQHLKHIANKFNLSSITKNWLILSASNICAQIIALIAAIRIARLLQPSGYGQLSIVQTTATIAVVVGGFGLRQVIIKECARSPKYSGSIFYKSALIQTVTIIPAIIGILIYFNFFLKSTSTFLIKFTVIHFMGIMLWELMESIAFGHENFNYSALLMIGGNLLWAIFAWSIPVKNISPELACTAMVIIQITKCIVYYIFFKREKWVRNTKNKISLIYIIKQCIPFYWLNLLSIITSNVPIIFLASRSSIDEVGIYTAGLKFSQPSHIFISAMISVLLPNLSRLYFEDKIYFISTIYNFIKKGTFFFIYLAFFISIFRFEIVTLMFGKDYIESQNVLFFLIWYTTFWCIQCIIGISLTGSNHHSLLARLSTICAIFTIPPLWFCSRFGAFELALGMHLTLAFNTTYLWYFFNRKISCNFPLLLPILLFSSIFTFMIISWFIPSYLSLYLRITLSILSLLIAFVIYRKKELFNYLYRV